MTYKYIKHGYTKHPLYGRWSNMKARCYNKNHHAYKNYGGRGIKVCEDWLEDIECFILWALYNGYKHGL